MQVGEIQLTFKAQAVQIQDAEQDQSTVFASIDMTTPSDRFLPVVKPEVKLRAMNRISQAFGSTLVLSEILEKVLTTLFEIFPSAERGFVLLEDRERGTLAPEAIHTRSGPPGDLKISKSILQRVLHNGQAVLSKDLPAEFPNSDSVSDSQIRSLMCVPILDQKQQPIGIMQIDTRDGRGRFDQEDLDLLVSVANQISVAVQNAQLHRDALKQNELERELQFARQVMQALLPERPASVPGYEFWDCYEPARHVGGDYYGFIPLARDSRHRQRTRAAVGHRGRRRCGQRAARCASDRQAFRGDPAFSSRRRPTRPGWSRGSIISSARTACWTCTSRSCWPCSTSPATGCCLSTPDTLVP